MNIEEIPRCSSCGACCSGEQQWGLILLPGEYERWEQEGRDDILAYIERSDNGFYHAIVFKDIRTGDHLEHCPFLLRVDAEQYGCAIQETKPKICSMFWCAWAYCRGDKGVPFRTLNGWTRRALKLGYGQCILLQKLNANWSALSISLNSNILDRDHLESGPVTFVP